MGRSAKVAPTEGAEEKLRDGAVVLAAITSCTNTSNPAVMMGAGLLARNAVAQRAALQTMVKTSLSPGSAVVADYLKIAGLQDDLDALGFQVTGFGCMSCADFGASAGANCRRDSKNDLAVGAVLSGNRNFEGRVHALCRVNYLASPMLVVAYALAGHLECNMRSDPLGTDGDGKPVYLKEIWPTPEQIDTAIRSTISPDLYRTRYATARDGDADWRRVTGEQKSAFRPGRKAAPISNGRPYSRGLRGYPVKPRISAARAL